MPIQLVSRPLGPSIVLLATATVVAIGACGYPTFRFDPAGAGGMGGGTPGTGGESVTSTSAASASSSSTGCMTTGMSTCSPTCGCAATQKCAVTDENAGTMTCITAGPVADWAKCNANQDCGASSFCDHKRNVCKPICDGAGQCPTNAQCIPAKQSDGMTDVTGLKLCTAHCDPVSAAPCGANITCFYDSKSVYFDCAAGSNLTEGVTCMFGTPACAKDLTCAGSTAKSTCAQWCTPINTTDKNPACPVMRPYCDPLTVNVNYEGTDYGICRAP